MDLKAFNHILKKVIALTPDDHATSNLSSLERDLLLSYIRDLYEAALDTKQVELIVDRVSRPAVESILTPASSPPVQAIVAEIVAPPVLSKVEVPAYVPPMIVAPTVETVVAPTPAYVERVAAPVAAVATAFVEPMTQPKVITTYAVVMTPELAELFAEDKVTELSDKLALSQVKDLTKSMGINEKIFTQQELFKNDGIALNEVLQRLNNCQTFDEAKHYLMQNVIDTYQWTSEHKLKKATTFVKLVRRRFI